MTDTEKSALCARIDELCAENERLRQQNAKLDELLPENERWFSFDVVRSLNDERDQLADENDKLLLLVNDMCACFRIGAEREGISKQWCYELFDTYTRKLQELGIEAHVKEDE